MRRSIQVVVFVLCAFSVSGCGPTAFVKGDYDKDVQKANLLNDKWSESDMQKAVKALVKSASQHRAVKAAKSPPVVMVTKLENKTSEHIDTQSIMDMIRVELMQNAQLSFVDKAAREDIKKEYEYQNSGTVSRETKKGPGGQVGADYIMNGRLDSIVQQAGDEKTVYYKLTLNLTNLQSGVIVWSDYKQIRKRFEKQSVGL